MAFLDLRQTLFGRDVDVRDSGILNRITVGVLAAFIAMGGDLLGSCVYGPDVLGRAAGGLHFVLAISAAATLGTLVVLAVAYTRMWRRTAPAGRCGSCCSRTRSAGGIYTGMESVSNGVPVLRDPKVRNARRTMLLVAGVRAAIIAALLLDYFLYGVNALRRRHDADARWRADAAVHATAFVLCAVILVGTFATRWKPSLVMVLLIAAGTLFALHVRRRYRAVNSAVAQLSAELPPVAATAPDVARDAPAAVVVLFGQRTGFPRLALKWLERMPLQFSEIVLAGVSLVDAEAVEGEERLRQVERERRSQLEAAAEDARVLGWRISVAVRRGADIIETAAELVLDIMHNGREEAIVIGSCAGAEASAIDPLLRDDDAVRLQTRLQRDKVPMTVVSIPLDA